jgi:hypothetical protein
LYEARFPGTGASYKTDFRVASYTHGKVLKNFRGVLAIAHRVIREREISIVVGDGAKRFGRAYSFFGLLHRKIYIFKDASSVPGTFKK